MTNGLDLALPEGWTCVPLKIATTFLNRGTAPDYVDDGAVRAIGQAANQAAGFDWTRTRFHDYHGDARDLKGYLTHGDVLINSTGTGTLGRVGYFAGGLDTLPCVADGHITVARADVSIAYPRYLFYWLCSRLFYEYVYSALIVGATNQIELNRERLAAAPTALPPLNEQRRIAEFLDAETIRIDRLSSARGQMRDLLALKRKRSVESILGFNSISRLLPLKYVVKSVSVGIVVTPARWYVEEGGVPALRGLNVQPGRIERSDVVQLSLAGHLENIKSRLSVGDVVVVRTGQAGAAAIVPREMDGCNCIDLLIVRPGRRANSSFLMHFLNSHYVQEAVSEHSVGSIQSHFNVGSLKNIGFPALEIEDQEHRASMLDDVVGNLDRLDMQLTAQLALLAERRQALITAAVTGQIDVTTARGANT